MLTGNFIVRLTPRQRWKWLLRVLMISIVNL